MVILILETQVKVVVAAVVALHLIRAQVATGHPQLATLQAEEEETGHQRVVNNS
jgi:hypothetical protein